MLIRRLLFHKLFRQEVAQMSPMPTLLMDSRGPSIIAPAKVLAMIDTTKLKKYYLEHINISYVNAYNYNRTGFTL